jgi:hypothetical protein
MHLTTDQIGRQSGPLFVVAVRPSILDHNVLTRDVTSFAQTLAESRNQVSELVGGSSAEESNYRQPLLRACRERQRYHSTGKAQKFPPPHVSPKAQEMKA